MNVVIAIDSLKGSLTSLEAGNTIAEGIKEIVPDAKVTVRPLADGGEGTVEALTLGMGGKLRKLTVTGPLGKPGEAVYGILTKESKNIGEITYTAIIEMASAAGITLVEEKDRNPLDTTTYGVGELICDAIKQGCRQFIIGIGGSATNDGGIGMLQALGYGMLDKYGKQVAYGAKGLRDLASITDVQVVPKLRDCSFRIACDVTNPLCGEQGCSAIFGPQKGATPEMILQMDGWLAEYAKLVRERYAKADPNHAGCGAAGGLGFAFLNFTNAVLESGIQIVLEETRLEEYIKDADLVITGEGRLDEQTAMGKAPIGVAGIAKRYRKKVIAFAGSVTPEADVCNANGIDAFFPIVRGPQTLEEAMDPEHARRNLKAAVQQVFRLIECWKESERSGR